MPPDAAGCLSVTVDAAAISHGHGPLVAASSIQRALIESSMARRSTVHGMAGRSWWREPLKGQGQLFAHPSRHAARSPA